MRRRAEKRDETRLRITEAAIRLHTTVGPANTSIAGVAAKAGVTRLTVYRHFPDLETLFDACRGQWAALNPGPDVDTWREIPSLQERSIVAFRDLYRWYRRHGDELLPIYRDAAQMPPQTREMMRRDEQHLADAIVEPHRGQPASRRLRALAGHFVSFWTWHSLTSEHGLDDDEAAAVAARVLAGEAVAGDR